MVLIGLLYKLSCNNLKSNKFPSHVIHVFKQDVSKIKRIQVEYKISAVKLNSSSIDLSKLKQLCKFYYYSHLIIEMIFKFSCIFFLF